MSSSAAWSSSPAPTRVRAPRRQRVGGLNTGAAHPVLVYLAIGFAIGLIIGLPILGWWLWPVRTTNAVPADLAPAYREAYVAMAADSFALSGDAALAKARLGSWDRDEAASIIASLQETAAASGSTVQTSRLQQLAAEVGLLDGSVSAVASGTTATQALTGDDAAVRQSNATPLVVVGLLLLAAGLVLGGYLVRRQGGLENLAAAAQALRGRVSPLQRPDFATLRRNLERGRPTATDRPAPTNSTPVETDEIDECDSAIDGASLAESLGMFAEDMHLRAQDAVLLDPEETLAPPVMAPRSAVDEADSLGVFMATYRHGSDEMFETNYYLAAGNDFLGECGVGVAETVGDASPEQACAMELWLFDKGDIGTAYKLLVTDFALDSQDVRDVLAGRGELVRATPGQVIHLETAGLRMQAELVSVKHGDAPQAPPRSYFQELTLELRVYRKN